MSEIPEVTVERRNIALTKPQVLGLEEIRKARDVTLPQVVRDAVDEYLEKWKREKKES
jgi:hypothetical protein